VTTPHNWPDAVLDFWFRELSPEAWFVRNDDVDRVVRERFLPLYEEISRQPQDATPGTARQALATVIVLDQFPRNLFRDSPRAFATDAHALAVAQRSIAAGLDRELNSQERMFLCMPFQHCEDRAVQVRSIELFTALGDESTLGYAHKHKEIIDRFGRYPHRNAVLGRASTPEEVEFLKTHPGF